jgi:hypothetical protein
MKQACMKERSGKDETGGQKGRRGEGMKQARARRKDGGRMKTGWQEGLKLRE